MGEKRRKNAAVLLRFPGKESRLLELFPAEAWPDDPAAEPGTVRVRLDGRWTAAGGEFLSLAGVGALAARLLAGVLDLAGDQAAPPDIPAKSRVRVHYGLAVAGVRLDSCLAWTETAPVQFLDGRWYVPVHIPGRCLRHIPCDDVEVLR